MLIDVVEQVATELMSANVKKSVVFWDMRPDAEASIYTQYLRDNEVPNSCVQQVLIFSEMKHLYLTPRVSLLVAHIKTNTYPLSLLSQPYAGIELRFDKLTQPLKIPCIVRPNVEQGIMTSWLGLHVFEADAAAEVDTFVAGTPGADIKLLNVHFGAQFFNTFAFVPGQRCNIGLTARKPKLQVLSLPCKEDATSYEDGSAIAIDISRENKDVNLQLGNMRKVAIMYEGIEDAVEPGGIHHELHVTVGGDVALLTSSDADETWIHVNSGALCLMLPNLGIRRDCKVHVTGAISCLTITHPESTIKSFGHMHIYIEGDVTHFAVENRLGETIESCKLFDADMKHVTIHLKPGTKEKILRNAGVTNKCVLARQSYATAKHSCSLSVNWYVYYTKIPDDFVYTLQQTHASLPLLSRVMHELGIVKEDI